jgi:Carboxypeptidase regulatory-like domain
MKFRIALAGLLLVFAPFLMAVQMTRLHIVIKSLDGKPIEHAAVTIKFVDDHMKMFKKMTTTWETRSNQEGEVKVPPMPQGKIRVQITAKGFQTFGEIYTVNEEDKTIEVKMNPPQPQYSAHQ